MNFFYALKSQCLITLLMLFCLNFSLVAQTYNFKVDAQNGWFFSESNWQVNTSNTSPSANSINPEKNINTNLVIDNYSKIIGTVANHIYLGSGNLTLNEAQLVMANSKGVFANAGKLITLQNSRLHTQFVSGATVNLNGSSELYIYGSGWPISSATVNITDNESKVYFNNVKPSVVIARNLSRIRVNGNAAINGLNVYVEQNFEGTVVYPINQADNALTVYSWIRFNGPSQTVPAYELFTGNNVPLGDNQFSSFKLKKGFVLVIAENEDGTGERMTYIADKDDLHISLNGTTLNNKVSLLRVMRWRNVNKKGSGGGRVVMGELDLDWFYTWGAGDTLTENYEYVPMQWGPWGLLNGIEDKIEFYERDDVNMILAFNEADNCSGQAGQFANLCDVDVAVAHYKMLLALGLRIGAPVVTDNAHGYEWLDEFMTKTRAQNFHVDFIPVHYYGTAGEVGFMNKWKAISDKWNLPIWLTEFNYGGPWTQNRPTAAQNLAGVKRYVDAMDNADYMERYALFSFNAETYYSYWSDFSTLSLSSLGDYYKTHQAARSYTNFGNNTDCNGVANGYAFINDCGDCVSGNTGKSIGDCFTVSSKDVDAIVEDNTEVKIYPNPFFENLKLEVSDIENAKAEVWNLNGQKLWEQTLLSNTTEVHLDTLAEGIYIVIISNSGRRTVKQVVKE